jgi:hypothetical protein
VFLQEQIKDIIIITTDSYQGNTTSELQDLASKASTPSLQASLVTNSTSVPKSPSSSRQVSSIDMYNNDVAI